MEQFPIREMVPLMMDDFKPSMWPISNHNLTNNEEILDYLSTHIYSKGASLLRLMEYMVGNETFQTAVRSIFNETDVSNILNTFYSNLVLPAALNTAITAEDFFHSWLDERNYPIVTVDFIPSNGTENKTTITFFQARYFGSFALDSSSLDPNYKWKIYMECDLGGSKDEDIWNLTANYAPSAIKFIFDSSTETFEFDEEYLWIKCNKDFYSFQVTEYVYKGDLIGIPDLTLDEKASASRGLLTFREEILTTDASLNSAQEIQTTAKIIVEHILQPWFSTTDWWDNIWFDKSLSSFLAYKMIDANYPTFNLMEQFPIREMVPLMMDDFKPSMWPISNHNLTNNEEILDYLSTHIYSKGASLLRLMEYMVGNDTFQTAVRSIFNETDVSNILNTFYSNLVLPAALNTSITAEDFFHSWLDERNYPIVTVDFIPSNGTENKTTITFFQARYFGSFALDSSSLDPNYKWKIYMECDLGGSKDGDIWNLTDNHAPKKINFMFDSSTETFELDGEYLWIKCNKDFYSFQVTEYVYKGGDPHTLWQAFELVFRMNQLFALYPNAGAGASSRKQAIDQVNMNIEWIKSREQNLINALETILQ
ncbi:unnamed protein product [Adineta steineri]|uniref:Peptidase M1 membrane alanine aminopeptidase domain-containing protein n=1 Tax=Adineta steineri TaxID=433720 RepID=A0A813N7Z2_9BILA|nr:unnamed protein product [Adineta steineri]